MKMLLVPCLLACFGMLFARAEIDAPKVWATVVQTKDLPAISQMIGHPGTTPWPKLISDQSASKNEDKQVHPSILGLALMGDILVYETKTPQTETESAQAITVYGALSHGLQSSGGYINLCLADSVNRLALARLAKLILQDTQMTTAAKKQLLENLSCSCFSLNTFIAMIRDESSLKLKPNTNLSNLQVNDARRQILAALGTNSAQVEYSFITKQAATSKIIENPNISILLQRMGQTEIVDQVFLAALLDYVVHGGRYDDLQRENVGPFQKTMNGRENLYKSEIMGINQTSLGIIIGLKEQLKKMVLKICLQTLL